MATGCDRPRAPGWASHPSPNALHQELPGILPARIWDWRAAESIPAGPTSSQNPGGASTEKMATGLERASQWPALQYSEYQQGTSASRRNTADHQTPSGNIQLLHHFSNDCAQRHYVIVHQVTAGADYDCGHILLCQQPGQGGRGELVCVRAVIREHHHQPASRAGRLVEVITVV